MELKKIMNKKQIIQKIMQKKEFSQLPKKDVELALEKFGKKHYLDEEKVKLTRKILMEVFSAFMSKKLFSWKERDVGWILRKHLSTRERIPYYGEIYGKILDGIGKEIGIIDLGAGVNGFSYKYFEKAGFNVDYLAIEAIGQLVKLMNRYFRREKIKARAVHLSLFELSKLKKEIRRTRKPRVVFLFKTIDSRSRNKYRNYCKKTSQKFFKLKRNKNLGAFFKIPRANRWITTRIKRFGCC